MPEHLNIALYITIFGAKMLENALGTLRMIVVANGQKLTGAILQFIIVILWLIVAGVVLTNIQDDVFKMIAYALGSGFGSFTGSIIEERLAIGSNMITVIVDILHGNKIAKLLRSKDIAVTELTGKGYTDEKKILMIVVKRKNKEEIISVVKSVDKHAMIMSESVGDITGGYIGK